jgi:lysophospholipase L1-like esterase
MVNARGTEGPSSSRARRATLFLVIVAAQFAVFEIGLRTWGSSEAAPSFQGLFQNDPVLGYRLKRHARTRFTTKEFSATIAVNGQGFRDDDEVGAKPPNERRILLLGDSLVLSVQVAFDQTFGQLLEKHLNSQSGDIRYRVINGGVQGYGPVEESLYFKQIVSVVQPDVVIPVLFVGNDAEEAVVSKPKLAGSSRSAASRAGDSIATKMRRLVRRSMVLQILRLRVVSATERLTPTMAPPEPPLQSYAAQPAPRIQDGLAVTRRCVEDIIATARGSGATTAIVFMPARFQVDDADYGRLKDAVTQAGGVLVRDGATQRFVAALATLPVPQLDVLPSLRGALPGPDLFFQETVHLTPRGHEVVAAALDRFIDEHRGELHLPLP